MIKFLSEGLQEGSKALGIFFAMLGAAIAIFFSYSHVAESEIDIETFLVTSYFIILLLSTLYFGYNLLNMAKDMRGKYKKYGLHNLQKH